jgi:GMP synthase-like glutamine amidotransferase
MKLGILKCDEVNEVFAHDHGQYPDMFAELLRPADPKLEFTVFDVEQGLFPKDIHAVDAYLITGSRHGVNDGFPWIAQLEEFIQTIHKAQKKVVGICFGHQLIAKALGGQVIKSPKGWGVGMSQNTIIQNKAWMQPFKQQFNLLVSHQDQVVKLPPGAEVLAASSFCPFYMMQLDNHIITIQGHPEFTKAYARDLMVSRETILAADTFQQGIKTLALSEDDALIAQWIVNFLHGLHKQ